MKNSRPDRDGFALVTTLLIVLVLGVMALGVVWIASSEKKTSFAEGVHIASLFAADAGGEAGINFIRVSDSPPPITNFGTMLVRDQGVTNLQGTQAYAYDTTFLRRQMKPGWGIEYLDYDYRIGSQGTASRSGSSNVDVVVSRLYREGY